VCMPACRAPPSACQRRPGAGTHSMDNGALPSTAAELPLCHLSNLLESQGLTLSSGARCVCCAGEALIPAPSHAALLPRLTHSCNLPTCFQAAWSRLPHHGPPAHAQLQGRPPYPGQPAATAPH